MSALVIDLGNTRWKIARADRGEIGTVVAGGYNDLAALRAAWSSERSQVDRILMASVVDRRAADRVLDNLQQIEALPVRQIRSTDPMPNMQTGYVKPEQLGVDRLLAMVAARARTARPICVIDAGTAITIDFVDRNGRHVGGFILPGLRMFRDCLLANTAIPRDAEVDEHAILGRDTPTAVALGARYAVAGLVERFTVGTAAIWPGETVQIFVGGGDAERFLGLLPQPCIKLGHLVLRGLAVVAAGGDS